MQGTLEEWRARAKKAEAELEKERDAHLAMADVWAEGSYQVVIQLEQLEIKLNRYRALSRAVYASAMLWMWHGESEASWEGDRFESFLDALAEHAGLDLAGKGHGDRDELLRMLAEGRSDG